MALHPNNQLLVDTLHALPVLDGRFTDLRLVNVNPATGERRGVLSLVFRAKDLTDGNPVALKFYDVSPAALTDLYRREAFKRECNILQDLAGRARCLQLVKGLTTYLLVVPNSLGFSVTLPCDYFAIEWLDEDIDSYFLDLGRFDVLEKLRLFKKMVLAVEALHRHRIFHRDLKTDNFRISRINGEEVVIAIDLGTAARLDSNYISATYGFSVGAPAYAAPEARCGLAGNRMVAPLTDNYSLGCLLFELFNLNHFFYSNHAANAGLDIRLSAMASQVTIRNDDGRQLEQWNVALNMLGRGVNSVDIDGLGSKIPDGVSKILNCLLADLTQFDYRKRPHDLSIVRGKLEQAIRVLQNEDLYQRQLARKREMRKRKLERAREVDIRFNRHRQIGAS